MITKMPDKNPASEIPKTGRIGQWVKVMEKEVNQSVLENVMQNVDQFTSASDPALKAAWIKGAIERLEKSVDEKTCINIMENRGRICCGSTLRKRTKKLMNESNSLDEFLNKLNNLRGYTFQAQDKNTIVGGYTRCYCGLVK